MGLSHSCCEQRCSILVCKQRRGVAQVLAWLRCKVKVLRNALVDSSAAFAGLGSDSLTIYAIGLLGEYLSEEWTRRLADSCHVSLGLLSCLTREGISSSAGKLLSTALLAKSAATRRVAISAP